MSEKLMENKRVSNNQLLDYIIGLQLGKIERNINNNKTILNSESEEAMANMIELLKMRTLNKNY